MNGQIDQLVKSLLQKDSLDQCSLQELQQFADRHPYFGAAQLLLTKKLQVEQSAQYDEQLQKTFLFFHNPLWVQQLLNDTGQARIIPAEKKEEIKEPDPVVETKVESEPEKSVVIDQQDMIPPVITPPPQNAEVPEEITSSGSIESDPVSAEIIPDKTEETVTVQPAKEELLFEPYHTVDYFASQGIRIREEEKPTDKFSQQLRSFTDWLKAMKKLPVSEIVTKTEPAAEQKVEQLAAHSLEEREVVTEAMAEVWEKQGNKEKAIDIYAKLSLLDPSKSVYFAAKIEDLKKLN